MNSKNIVLAALALGSAIGGLAGGGVGHAATSDVDQMRLTTHRGQMVSALTWSHVVYNGERRDQGEHHFVTLHLTPNSCADVTINWFDAGNAQTPNALEEHTNICHNVVLDEAYQFDLSRLNDPPAVKAVVCIVTRPLLGAGVTETACATSLPFFDSPFTGI
jgi:hypothetical protein